MSLKSLVLMALPPLARRWAERLQASNVGRALARGAFWSMTALVAFRLSVLASSIVIARVLGKERFAEVGIIMSTASMFRVLAVFGLGAMSAKFVAEFKKHDPARAGRILALSQAMAVATSLLAALGLMLAAPWLASRTLAAPQLTPALRIGALMVMFSAVNAAQYGSLCGFEAFRSIAIATVAAGAADFVLRVVGAWLGGVTGAVWGMTAGMACLTVCYRFALGAAARKANVPMTSRGWHHEWRIVFAFSLPAVLCTMLLAPTNWFCNALLVRQPGGYAEMGIYAAANQWRMAVAFVPGTLARVVLPTLSKLRASNEMKTYGRVLKWNLAANALFASGVVAVVSLLSVPIMSSYGEGFVAGWPVLIILAFCAALVGITKVMRQAIASQDRMWWSFLITIAWAAALIAGSWMLIPKMGAAGRALAACMAFGLQVCLQIVLVFLKFARASRGAAARVGAAVQSDGELGRSAEEGGMDTL